MDYFVTTISWYLIPLTSSAYPQGLVHIQKSIQNFKSPLPLRLYVVQFRVTKSLDYSNPILSTLTNACRTMYANIFNLCKYTQLCRIFKVHVNLSCHCSLKTNFPLSFNTMTPKLNFTIYFLHLYHLVAKLQFPC